MIKGKSIEIMKVEIRKALEKDRTIDIITIGAKSGLPRKIEIWFTYEVVETFRR